MVAGDIQRLQLAPLGKRAGRNDPCEVVRCGREPCKPFDPFPYSLSGELVPAQINITKLGAATEQPTYPACEVIVGDRDDTEVAADGREVFPNVALEPILR